MISLVFNIKYILQNHRLIRPGSKVIVAVSAGPDSMALLHILAFLRHELQFSPIAVYIDHGLRPLEVPAEIDCVRKAADNLSLPWEIIAVDTRSLITAKKMSTEHAARELRYEALRACACRHGATRIAVAHTADDQVEEFLLRLLRGSGRKGLAGMCLRHKEVVRPLLTTTKQQILNYLEEHDIQFCQDSSNRELRFLRNRIRHILLPMLEEEFDSGIRKALLKTAANLAEDEDYLEARINTLWPRLVTRQPDGAGKEIHLLKRQEFREQHPCLQRRLIERLLWHLGSPARYEHIMAILTACDTGRTGSELHLTRGLRVRVEREHLEFSYPRGKTPWRGSLRDPA